jgi:hypothetical protein
LFKQTTLKPFKKEKKHIYAYKTARPRLQPISGKGGIFLLRGEGVE